MKYVDKTLQKISLALLAGDTCEEYNYTRDPLSFDFIFGIGTEGLTPFELTLNEMKIQEEVEIKLTANELEPFFGNLFIPFCKRIGLQLIPQTLCLLVTLQNYSDPSAREIVQAMAKSVGHGGGCSGNDCGCGCH